MSTTETTEPDFKLLIDAMVEDGLIDSTQAESFLKIAQMLPYGPDNPASSFDIADEISELICVIVGGITGASTPESAASLLADPESEISKMIRMKKCILAAALESYAMENERQFVDQVLKPTFESLEKAILESADALPTVTA